MADENGGTGSTGTAAASTSAASSTATTSTTSAQPASATATPSASGTAAATTSATGEPPQERWPDILNNARTKTRSEVETEYRTKYGWADEFQRDPVTFVENWMAKLAEHPEHGQRFTTNAARLLASRRGQTVQVQEEPQPNVPIQDANGNITGYTYDAKQLKAWRDWDWTQKQAALDQRLAPFEKDRADREQQAFVQEIRAKSDESARSTLTELRLNPYFKEHETKVKAALAAHEEWGDNVDKAFNHVLVTDILPNLSHSEQRKVVESLQLKAGASTVNPGGQTGSPPPKFNGFGEAARYYAEHPDEAAAMAKR